MPANGFVTLAARVRQMTNEPVISSCSGQVPPSAEGLVAQFLNSVAGYKMSVEVVDGRVDVQITHDPMPHFKPELWQKGIFYLLNRHQERMRGWCAMVQSRYGLECAEQQRLCPLTTG